MVRWIDHGVGCSKVPDIHDVALMEDRATLRISSQLLANWLRHGIVTEADVVESPRAHGTGRRPSERGRRRPTGRWPRTSTRNIAFQAAKELILEGTTQPSGYTEPILHRRRREYKATFA